MVRGNVLSLSLCLLLLFLATKITKSVKNLLEFSLCNAKTFVAIAIIWTIWTTKKCIVANGHASHSIVSYSLVKSTDDRHRHTMCVTRKNTHTHKHTHKQTKTKCVNIESEIFR